MNQFQPQAHIDRDEIILLVVSNGLDDFVRNTVTSIRRCGVTTPICIALPKHALPEVQTAVSGFNNVQYYFLEDVCGSDYSAMTEYFNFGSETFCRFMRSKWKTIRFLLECGFLRVIYTDVDVVWIRNPLPLLKQVLERYEIAMQTEGVESFPPQYCCGFMSLRNCEFVIKLLKQLEDLLGNEVTNDQFVFNDLIASSDNLVYRIHGLSELLFANGLNNNKASDNDDVLVANCRPIIFHSNWTIGLENKRLLLQRTGNWLIEQPRNSSFDKKHAIAMAIVRISGGRRIARHLLKGTRFAYLTVPPE
jgi:hypothetical protein